MKLLTEFFGVLLYWRVFIPYSNILYMFISCMFMKYLLYKAGCDGVHLLPQHLGSWGRWLTWAQEFKASPDSARHSSKTKHKNKRNKVNCPDMVVNGFNFSTQETWEAEAFGSPNSRPSWTILWVPGQPGPMGQGRVGIDKQRKTKYIISFRLIQW